MSVDLDDPRLTAYALGELDSADREAIEATLRDDPEGRAFVAGIQETARLLTEELGHEPTLVLDAARRDAIEGRITAPTPPPKPLGRRRVPVVPLAMAAGLIGLAVVLVLPAVKAGRNQARRASAEGFALAESKAPKEDRDKLSAEDLTALSAASLESRMLKRRPTEARYAPLATSEPTSGGVKDKKIELQTEDAVVKGKESLSDSLGIEAPPGEKRSQMSMMMRSGSGRTEPHLGRDGSRPAARQMGDMAGMVGGMGGSDGAMGMSRGGRAETQAAGQVAQDRGRSRSDLAQVPAAKAAPSDVHRKRALYGREGVVSSEGKSPQAARPNFGLPYAQTSTSNDLTSQKPGMSNGQGVPTANPEPLAQFRADLYVNQNKNQGQAGEARQAPQGQPAPANGPVEPTKPETKPVAVALHDVEGNAAGDKDPDLSRTTPKILVHEEEAQQVDRKADFERNRIGREEYARFYDNPFVNVLPDNRLSTFSIDVDTAAYANVRRFLSQGQLPPVDAVRIEEMVNYFTYDDPAPKGDVPFSVNVEVAACPWNGSHRLARIGLKGRAIDLDKRPSTNLVFLIDVSGSMGDLNKLPLLKAGMKLLVEQLTENDRVAIVTYANGTNVPLPSISCDHKPEILAALDNLQAGGGTNGGAGIELAYQQAEKFFIKGGTNRVILGTDGDFNVGVSKEELLARSEQRAKSGICLSVLGFGEGNLQDRFMEQLADKGNGNYSYIDTIGEARKVLVQQLSGTLNVIAKDVKIQLEFNPAKVGSYRLIGYENRVMANEDFRNDKKDAGEIGAGHSVTALYEIVPVGQPTKLAAADKPYKYGAKLEVPAAGDAVSPELLTVFLRYKQPDGEVAKEINHGVVDDGRDLGRASADFKFSAAVAGFGMLLRESPHKGTLTYPAVREIAGGALGDDKNGYRKEFLGLVDQTRQIVGQ